MVSRQVQDELFEDFARLAISAGIPEGRGEFAIAAALILASQNLAAAIAAEKELKAFC